MEYGLKSLAQESPSKFFILLGKRDAKFDKIINASVSPQLSLTIWNFSELFVAFLLFSLKISFVASTSINLTKILISFWSSRLTDSLGMNICIFCILIPKFQKFWPFKTEIIKSPILKIYVQINISKTDVVHFLNSKKISLNCPTFFLNSK